MKNISWTTRREDCSSDEYVGPALGTTSTLGRSGNAMKSINLIFQSSRWLLESWLKYLAGAHRQLYAESQDSFSALDSVHAPWLKY